MNSLYARFVTKNNIKIIKKQRNKNIIHKFLNPKKKKDVNWTNTKKERLNFRKNWINS